MVAEYNTKDPTSSLGVISEFTLGHHYPGFKTIAPSCKLKFKDNDTPVPLRNSKLRKLPGLKKITIQIQTAAALESYCTV